ncbi:hypothetical protein [Neptunicella marina]|uniref:Uncharacterized protein n=1 Tax=Neptunicella marina TaxID=2125989 RepID=A0A8J6IRY9_9ALTE|nr:hypothetical protein [Neptunicella marina]MBC3765691.1 hypothetical protein [Neptunicella marina]
MTKLEFATKLEKYEKKQRRSKWEYFVIGLVFLMFTFIPSSILYFDENMFGFTSTTFAILAGLCLSKAWDIKRGTEEHELLINALELLSTSNDT